MKYKKSSVLYNKGLRHLVGSVNSPVRAFASVGGNPLFIKEAKGSRIIDVDGNNYVDLVLSYGPMVIGHRHKRVEKKISNIIARDLKKKQSLILIGNIQILNSIHQ